MGWCVGKQNPMNWGIKIVQYNFYYFKKAKNEAISFIIFDFKIHVRII